MTEASQILAERFGASPDVLHLRTSNGARVLRGRHYSVSR
jgi:hypothetical protein